MQYQSPGPQLLSLHPFTHHARHTLPCLPPLLLASAAVLGARPQILKEPHRADDAVLEGRGRGVAQQAARLGAAERALAGDDLNPGGWGGLEGWELIGWFAAGWVGRVYSLPDAQANGVAAPTTTSRPHLKTVKSVVMSLKGLSSGRMTYSKSIATTRMRARGRWM
jgi:hypothetical protein